MPEMQLPRRIRRRHADREGLSVLGAGFGFERTALLPHLIDAILYRLWIVSFVEHRESVPEALQKNGKEADRGHLSKNGIHLRRERGNGCVKM